MKEAQTKTIADATLVDYQNNLITIASTTALPPGSRVQFQLNIDPQLNGQALLGKVVSIRPSNRDRFILGIRLNSIKREQRLALQAKRISG